MKEFVLVVTVLIHPGQKYEDTFVWDKYQSKAACEKAGPKVEREFAYYENQKIRWKCEVLSTD